MESHGDGTHICFPPQRLPTSFYQVFFKHSLPCNSELYNQAGRSLPSRWESSQARSLTAGWEEAEETQVSEEAHKIEWADRRDVKLPRAEVERLRSGMEATYVEMQSFRKLYNTMIPGCQWKTPCLLPMSTSGPLLNHFWCFAHTPSPIRTSRLKAQCNTMCPLDISFAPIDAAFERSWSRILRDADWTWERTIFYWLWYRYNFYALNSYDRRCFLDPVRPLLNFVE
jgi:hypothetical protein